MPNTSNDTRGKEQLYHREDDLVSVENSQKSPLVRILIKILSTLYLQLKTACLTFEESSDSASTMSSCSAFQSWLGPNLRSKYRNCINIERCFMSIFAENNCEMSSTGFWIKKQNKKKKVGMQSNLIFLPLHFFEEKKKRCFLGKCLPISGYFCYCSSLISLKWSQLNPPAESDTSHSELLGQFRESDLGCM